MRLNLERSLFPLMYGAVNRNSTVIFKMLANEVATDSQSELDQFETPPAGDHVMHVEAVVTWERGFLNPQSSTSVSKAVVFVIAGFSNNSLTIILLEY